MQKLSVLFISLVVTFASLVCAADVFHYIPLQDLKLSEGSLPSSGSSRRIPWRQRRGLRNFMRPYVVFDGDTEGYLHIEPRNVWNPSQSPASQVASTFIAVRVGNDQSVSGALFVPEPDWRSMRRLKFSIPATKPGDAGARNRFYEAKEEHYKRLQNMDIPGAAWFRYKAELARQQRRNKELGKNRALGDGQIRNNSGRRNQLTRSYRLFSGGRAVSENLQLDRVLRLRDNMDNKEMIPVSEIDGITTAEIDWDPIIEGMNPETDALATAIPRDQHAIFFPSFKAMLTMMDQSAEQGTPVLRMLEPRSENALTRARYEQQLCLEASQLSRKLGPHLIASVAYTGSDPYLRTGSDLAVLFEAKKTMPLVSLIAARQGEALTGDAKEVSGKIAGVDYRGAVSPDRCVCSYAAVIKGKVIVSNSLVQMRRIIETIQNQTPSIAETPEYTFFRDRYQRGADETALLVLTDAAIRRWCSPVWRIGASRRTRAAAVLSELQARYLKDLASGKVETGPLNIENTPDYLGQLRLTEEGITSSKYGNLQFLTPIVELKIKEVTKAESEAYDWFRRSYQRNWRGFFDPIAVKFSLQENKLAADITVRPLIASSDYREFMAVTGKATVEAQDGDPHEQSIMHIIMSLDKESEPVRQVTNFAMQMAPGLQAKPLGWMGSWLSVYVDEDPLWDDLRQKAKSADDKEEVFEEFMEKNGWHIPVALVVEVKNSFKLTGFLAALRGFIEQTGPGMTAWETRKHEAGSYVRVSPTEQAKQGMSEDERQKDMAVYYAITPNALVLSPNEDVIKRALVRRDGKENAESGKPASFGRDWLGKSLSAQLDAGALTVLQAVYEENLKRVYRRRSWGNLPILNEWKREFGAEDPVSFHREYWQTLLVCPGNGEYVWDQENQTMASTTCGSPATPKSLKEIRGPLKNIKATDMGITFEDDGLRGRVKIAR
ncbi:MAG: hypothetical protein R6V56_06340 [Lentisphaeria bacterium]